MKKFVSNIKKQGTLLLLLLLNSEFMLAQNASDSDLSNMADSNKNWREGWWLFALIFALILIVFFVYRRKKAGNSTPK